MTNNILIIGCNSFAGSHLTKYMLDKKDNVVGTYRNEKIVPYCKYHNNLQRFQYDINIDTDKIIDLIVDNNFDCIFNFAAQSTVQTSWDDPSLWLQTNALSPMEIINKSHNYINKFIQMSTPEVYGNIIGKECDIYNPSTPYAVSKAALDMYTKCMYDNKEFPIINTRASNWYGPYQQEYKIIPATILKILKKEKLKLDGGGESLRNFMYIEDVCNALYTIMNKGKVGNTYHISANEYLSIKELVSIICSLMNYDYNNLVEIVDERLGKDKDYHLDSMKLMKLGWLSTYHIKVGLDKTIDWYINNE